MLGITKRNPCMCDIKTTYLPLNPNVRKWMSCSNVDECAFVLRIYTKLEKMLDARWEGLVFAMVSRTALTYPVS